MAPAHSEEAAAPTTLRGYNACAVPPEVNPSSSGREGRRRNGLATGWRRSPGSRRRRSVAAGLRRRREAEEEEEGEEEQEPGGAGPPMEEAKAPSDSGMVGHGPESWLSGWERQCLEEDERQEAGPESGPGGSEAEAQRQRLWLCFQNSATAIAQLYKDRVYEQQLGIQSLWKPFQAAATSVTCLYKDGLEAYRASLDLGVQAGYQRRNKEMLAWVKKRRHIIHREDLLSFLCRKSPPGAMANVSVRSGTPGSPTHGSSNSASVRRRGSLQDVDLNSFIAEEMAHHLDSSRKRAPAQCSDIITESPSHKRSRML
ncbi:hypothetical protein chiPu_0019368 [Chiloscyllium punctatum]|uniref:Uncharacterized protein n=1 Tax=Chiloscyllium punctatum TaxID=137246 RepID=A0A401RRN0_CHIPU|nr:hypothetical protein [Chiloscyllium punctatum]